MIKNFLLVFVSCIFIILLLLVLPSLTDTNNYTLESIDYKVTNNGKAFIYTDNIIIEVPNVYKETDKFLVELNDNGTPDYFNDDKLVWISLIKQ